MRNSNAPYGQIHVRYDSFMSAEAPAPVRVKLSKHDKIKLLIISAFLGMAILLFHYGGEFIIGWLPNTPLAEYYSISDAAFNVVQIIYSMSCIMIPFSLGALLVKLVDKKTVLLPLNKPNSKRMFFAALGVGFLALVISNFVTTFFVLGAEGLGFYFETGESPAPDTASSFLWQVLSTAVVPALAEEFAVRGVIMQSLRKYGDMFAIGFSALIFALLHGNMVQAPFALLLGCVMGWLVITTNSLWTGIAIHFMNNFYATVMNAVSANYSQSVYVPIFLIINGVGAACGIYAVIAVVGDHRRKHRLCEPGGNTKSARLAYRGQVCFYTLISPPMAAALVILIINIAKTIHYLGFVGG